VEKCLSVDLGDGFREAPCSFLCFEVVLVEWQGTASLQICKGPFR
jgi:hypothetical protein